MARALDTVEWKHLHIAIVVFSKFFETRIKNTLFLQGKILILICNRYPVNLVEIKLTVCCFYFAKKVSWKRSNCLAQDTLAQ